MCVARNFGTLIAVNVIIPVTASIQEIKTGDLKISANVESKVKHMDEIGVFFFRAIAYKEHRLCVYYYLIKRDNAISTSEEQIVHMSIPACLAAIGISE